MPIQHQPTILLSMGTRPEVIKMAPVYHELRKSGIKPILLHTGQHNGMATSLYKLFGMETDYSIDLGRQSVYPKDSILTDKTGDMAELSAVLLQKLSPIMAEVDPSVVVVHGDTTSALMAAMSAFYHKIPVAHVEAGLRSYQAYHPFPEEKNREMIARLANWHFAPTERSAGNLLREGIDPAHIYTVGNTIVEATQMGASQLDKMMEESPQFLPDTLRGVQAMLGEKRVVLVTAHRRENQTATIHSLAAAVRDLLVKYDDLVVVWSVHPNPQVTYAVHAALDDIAPELASRLFLTEPLRYPVLLWVLKHAWVVLTDSGGIQEEAVALQVPVLVARDATERPEVIESGAGKLVGTARETIVSEIEKLYHNKDAYRAMCNVINPFGDGKTAQAICKILIETLQVELPDTDKFHG